MIAQCLVAAVLSGVAGGGGGGGGGVRGLEHPPLRWSGYAVNGSGQ